MGLKLNIKGSKLECGEVVISSKNMVKERCLRNLFFSRKPCGAGTSLVGAEKALVLF